MMNNLNEIWIKQFASGNNQIVRDLLELKNGLICYVGTISASGSRLFQVQIKNSLLFDDKYLKRFHGVEVRVIPKNNEIKEITIILSDPDLIDVFSMFIEDLINELEKIDSESDIPLCVNSKINNWERLFAKISGLLLSKESQRGLYGELIILFDLLKISSNHVKCISSWSGPEGSNQDFSNEASALEIKTTKATSPSINISNELQLDWTILSNLFLGVVHVDEINNGKETLENLILSIKSKIVNNSNLLLLFEDKLAKAGIPVGDETNYNKIGYIIRSKKFYRIVEGFPVLINSSINQPAIHNVKYQLDVSSFDSFFTDFETITNYFI